MKDKSASQGDTRLKSAVQSASWNILVSVLCRILTFILNAFILRRIAPEDLGVLNVRLTLLDDTIIFISREAFRRACLSQPEKNQWRRRLNLIWMVVPLSVIVSFLLGYVWIFWWVLPDTNADQYKLAVVMVGVSSVVLMFSEPLLIVAQVHQLVKIKPIADFLWLAIRSLLLTAAVIFDPLSVIWWSGFIHLFATVVYVTIYVGYFAVHMSQRKDDDFPFKSLSDFLPSWPLTDFDRDKFLLAQSFFTQGLVKQLLTEGEKYMMTVFNLLNFSQQGVYDVVANLGSLPARFIFRNVEDSAYAYFSQTIQRGDHSDTKREKDVAKYLFHLIRTMTLLGLIILTFGSSYSTMFLHLYGGANLSEGIGPQLMRAHCVYILFLAVNGVTECYSFAAMSKAEVDAYNYKMAAMTGVFIVATLVLTHVFGPVGFILANCCNFGMRIFFNFRVITRRHRNFELNPVRGVVLPFDVAAVLLLSGFACYVSESFLYPVSFVFHFVLGATCFVFVVLVVIAKEPQLYDLIADNVAKVWNKVFRVKRD